MIECVRFLLSAIVLEAHIWPLGVPWLAWASVFAFYTLSGFLMTRVLHRRYGFSLTGGARFAANRVLRLWPSYLVVLGTTAVVLCLPGTDRVYGLLHLPIGTWDALANVFVVGLVSFDFTYMVGMTLMVPNAWSLSVEVCCYALLAVGFARSPAWLAALAVLGVAMLAWSTGRCVAVPDSAAHYAPYCFQNRYGVLQAGFVPFALGGLLHFHGAALRRPVRRALPVLAAWRSPFCERTDHGVRINS